VARRQCDGKCRQGGSDFLQDAGRRSPRREAGNRPASEDVPGAGRFGGNPLWDADHGKSYVIPAVEILGFQFPPEPVRTGRVVDHGRLRHGQFVDPPQPAPTPWVIDKDPFSMNQVRAPLLGASIYHGLSRGSAGLTYWESLGLRLRRRRGRGRSRARTDPPSLNDLLTTTFAGRLPRRGSLSARRTSCSRPAAASRAQAVFRDRRPHLPRRREIKTASRFGDRFGHRGAGQTTPARLLHA